jgi:Mg2+/Co2+ transporter CorB
LAARRPGYRGRGTQRFEAQSIPNAGQAFTFHGFRFEVLEREQNRLTRLLVRKLG